MAVKDLKFKESDFVGQDVSSLPDQIEGQAAFIKARIDNIAKNMIALGRFNSLIDMMEANNNGINATTLNGKKDTDFVTAAVADVSYNTYPNITLNTASIKKKCGSVSGSVRYDASYTSGGSVALAQLDTRPYHTKYFPVFTTAGDYIGMGSVDGNGILRIAYAASSSTARAQVMSFEYIATTM